PPAPEPDVTAAVPRADPRPRPVAYDDDRFQPRRLAPLAWAAAAVVALLLGLAAWAFLGDGGDDGDTASSDTSPSTTAAPATTTTAAPTTEAAPEPTSPTTVATTVTTTVTTEAPQETTTTTAAREAAGGDGEIEASSVQQYLDEYHRLVTEDPVAAYRQAGPTLQGAISEEGFVRFWGRFDDVSVTEVRVLGRDAAEANLELRFTDGSRQVERHRFDFLTDGGNLVLDRDTFIETVG
ncbi:MAG TPA: hypothetical protein VHK88_13675, partial [Aquihabitans sp.]|nr:hypothetical protein [Aquihabitans sp.]